MLTDEPFVFSVQSPGSTHVFYRQSQKFTCEYELFDAQSFQLFEPLVL